MRPRFFRPREREPRRNLQIRAPRVFLIDEKGEKIGIKGTNEALKLAQEKDLDLIEVAPHLSPPIAKLADYGKFKYERRKQAKGKKQKILEIKEIRLSVNIDEHDLATKLKKATEFLHRGHKIKLNLFFRGRQLAHKELGEVLLKEFTAKLENYAILEQAPSYLGRMLSAVLTPRRK